MRTIISAIILFILCGGGSLTAFGSDGKSLPLSADAATIYFFRAKCPPVAAKGTLSIDGLVHSVVPIRRYATARITPGKHELKFAFPLWAGTPSKKLVIEAAPNSTHYYYYTTDMGFVVGAPATATITPELVEVSEENAKKLMTEFERVP